MGALEWPLNGGFKLWLLSCFPAICQSCYCIMGKEGKVGRWFLLYSSLGSGFALFLEMGQTDLFYGMTNSKEKPIDGHLAIPSTTIYLPQGPWIPRVPTWTWSWLLYLPVGKLNSLVIPLFLIRLHPGSAFDDSSHASLWVWLPSAASVESNCRDTRKPQGHGFFGSSSKEHKYSHFSFWQKWWQKWWISALTKTGIWWREAEKKGVKRRNS